MKHLLPAGVLELIEYDVYSIGLENADNFRAFRFKDDFLFEEYVKAGKRGCCGAYYGSITYEGDIWYIGCNYGH